MISVITSPAAVEQCWPYTHRFTALLAVLHSGNGPKSPSSFGIFPSLPDQRREAHHALTPADFASSG